MLPFSWKEEKTVERYHRLLGDELQKQILTLHEADDAAKRQ